MLDRCPRYLPILEFLEGRSVDSILEVGCGPRGLGEFRSEDFIGCDVSFPPERSQCLIPVVAKGQSLPFRDETFDLVLCQDTLEHVPPDCRIALVEELLRVSRKHVIVGFPRGKWALLADRVYRFYHERIRCFPPVDWVTEHMKIPPVDVREFENFLNSHPLSIRRINRENVAMHVLLIAVEHFPRINRRLVKWVREHPQRARPLFRILDIPPAYRTIYFIEKRGSELDGT
jgi:SAM-dependent methyltransferase